MLEYLSMLSPTLNLQVGDVKSIPLVDADRDNIEKMVRERVAQAEQKAANEILRVDGSN